MALLQHEQGEEDVRYFALRHCRFGFGTCLLGVELVVEREEEVRRPTLNVMRPASAGITRSVHTLTHDHRHVWDFGRVNWSHVRKEETVGKWREMLLRCAHGHAAPLSPMRRLATLNLPVLRGGTSCAQVRD